jgi:hypothetical protein
MRKFGPVFLTPEEMDSRMRPIRAEYLRVLAEATILGREPEFWAYHRRGLETIGEVLPSNATLMRYLGRAAVKAIAKPGWFLAERRRYKRPAAKHVRRAEASESVSIASHGAAAAAGGEW